MPLLSPFLIFLFLFLFFSVHISFCFFLSFLYLFYLSPFSISVVPVSLFFCCFYTSHSTTPSLSFFPIFSKASFILSFIPLYSFSPLTGLSSFPGYPSFLPPSNFFSSCFFSLCYRPSRLSFFSSMFTIIGYWSDFFPPSSYFLFSSLFFYPRSRNLSPILFVFLHTSTLRSHLLYISSHNRPPLLCQKLA